ncbi:hypothetical protein KC353_g585 [Hortaea werneckii]|nr:hypothetical protein KC353_g585 [Hortaea werneckii]
MLVDKEATIGGSVLADIMGPGKTALFVSLMIAGNVSEAKPLRVRQEPLAQGINAVVVPSSLAAYITEELYDMMGAQWKVCRLGRHKQLCDNSNQKRTIKIGQHQAPWLQGEANAPPLSQRVLGMTYEQLSLLQNDNRNGLLLGNQLLTSDSPDQWQNLFRRMIYDESDSLLRFDETLRGKNVRRFAPKHRHVVTGTPILRTARDFRGYVALVERSDRLRSDIDRNEEADANGDMRADGRCNWYREEVN